MIKNITVLVFLIVNISSYSQNNVFATYKVIPNSLYDLIDLYPDKKESIGQKIESLPVQFVDFVLVKNILFQVNKSIDSSIFNMKIMTKEKVYVIDKNFELTEEYIEASKDSVHVEEIKMTDDTLFYYDLKESNAMPLRVALANSIDQNQFEGVSLLNNYPEFGFILKYGAFPIKFIYGKPKILLTYELINTINTFNNSSDELIIDLVKNIKSENSRKKIFEVLTQIKPVVNTQ